MLYDSAKASYWNGQNFYTGTTKVAVDANLVAGSLVQVQFQRTEATGIREDVALFDLHLSMLPGGNVLSMLNDADAAIVETALDALWTTIKPRVTSHWVLSSYTWRHFSADFPLGETGLSKPGVTWRVTSRNLPGTSTATTGVPDQSSANLTFLTSSRKHWGRVYLPPVHGNDITLFSRWGTTSVDLWAGAFNTLFDTLTNNARAIHPVIYSTKYRGALHVRGLQMDDVPDVIRSRRPKTRTYRKTYGLVT